MSRVGKNPVTLPKGVTVDISGQNLKAKGKLGELKLVVDNEIEAKLVDGVVKITPRNEGQRALTMWGTTRALVNNMVIGVTTGFEKKLKIEGVGYGAKLDKKAVVLSVGFANQIKLEPPAGVTAEVPDPNTIIVKGADKQMVGQFAAECRLARPPEPYQGKGVRYENEVVRRKEGKSFASGG